MSTEKYPTLRSVVDMLVNDQGLSVTDADAVDLEDVLSDVNIKAVEADLAKLSKADLETIAIGDEDEWPPIYAKMKNPETVHRALDELFMHIGG